MKFTSGTIYDTIRKDHLNTVVPVLSAEWNHNRFYKTRVDNTPAETDEGYDVEMFPIESITKNDRPLAGIAKAMTDQATITKKHHTTVPAYRYYVCSTEDLYKYWQSPVPANGAGVLTKCLPRVEYTTEADASTTVKANKVAWTFENSWAQPTAYTVQIKTSTGGSWATIGTNVPISSKGFAQIWYKGGTATLPASWTTDRTQAPLDADTTTPIYAVQLMVTALNKPNAYCNVIELGARLELDLSADLTDVSDTFNIGEQDFITPVGTISTNTATLTLFNESRTYSNDNPTSPLYNLLDRGVKFNLVYRYNGSADVQQFSLYSDTWTENFDETSVQLVDGSKPLQEIKPRPVLYQDMPVQECIWRLLDTVGFTNYAVSSLDTSPSAIVDVFWTTGEETVWEVLADLARGTQTAIYFDGFGVLQVRTREAMFNAAKTPAWTLRDSEVGTDLPDIMSVDSNDSYEANKVTVTYQPTGFSEERDGQIPMAVVWEPSGTVVLRASELRASLTSSATNIYFTPKDASVWPWKGFMQIEGEWIEYEGKEYRYYDNTTRKVKIVTNYADQKDLDNLAAQGYVHLNGYTGRMIATERGAFNTEPKAHNIDLNGWSSMHLRRHGPGQGVNSPAGGIALNKGQSTLTIQTSKNANLEDYTFLYRGNAVDVGYYHVGTRLKIDKSSHKDKCAGIYFNADDSRSSGYFVEIMATSKMDGKMRNNRNEIILYSQKADGTKKQFGGEKIVSKDKSSDNKKNQKTITGLGAEHAVLEDRYVELDIEFSVNGSGDHIIEVFGDGRRAFTATIPSGSGWLHSRISRFGLYARGNTKATFDYVYGLPNNDIIYKEAEVFQDRINGGWYSSQKWFRDWTYETRRMTKKQRKRTNRESQKYNQRFFEEFGPVAHEIREFDVKLNGDSGLPVLHSKLFSTNDTQSVTLSYTGTPSTANFMIANTDRNNCVLNGDDNLTALGEGTINHKLFVYGRPVIQKDAKSIVRTDTWAQRRRGVIEVEYQSKWIQNDGAAKGLADWLTQHWSRSDYQLNVEIFGNPLIELGDVVAMDYEDMAPATHKFFVVGIATGFDAGITTQLTLRRAA